MCDTPNIAFPADSYTAVLQLTCDHVAVIYTLIGHIDVAMRAAR